MIRSSEVCHFRTFTANEAVKARGMVDYAQNALSTAFSYRIRNGIDRD
jgi:hypothetical protein